jgi:nucleoporin GLE1
MKSAREKRKSKKKTKVEVEAKLKAEEVKRAALEVERKTATEAERRVEKDAIEISSKTVTSGATQDAASSLSNTKTKESGYVYRAAVSALNLEQGRLQKLKELCERNQKL